MVVVKQITKTQFLEYYSLGMIQDPVGPVTVGAEKRFYGRTTRDSAKAAEGYVIVYFVD